jgi:hypothetical protein
MFKLKSGQFQNVKFNKYKPVSSKNISSDVVSSTTIKESEEEKQEISVCRVCGITNEYVNDTDYICWSCKNI